MGFLMFVVAAIIFFLDAAKITHVDPLWGFFFLALGHVMGYIPMPSPGWWDRRPVA